MTDHSDTELKSTTRWGVVAAAVVVVLAVDQLTKWWALNNLIEGPKDLIWTLRLRLAFNTGMAFSTGSGAGPIIGAIALCIAVALVFFARRIESRFQLLLVGMIIGGAFGNVIDRLMRVGELGSQSGFMGGAVVDFIDLQWWPIFNIADAAVVVGGIALALTSFREVDDDEGADSGIPTGTAGGPESDR